MKRLNDMHENEISKIVLDLSIKIHKGLGPGLLESAYENILCYEIEKAGLSFQTQVEIPIQYDGKIFDKGFRADVIIEDKVLIELKSVKRLADIHKKQLLTYLRLADLKLGLLINYNEKLLKDGFIRIVNGL